MGKLKDFVRSLRARLSTLKSQVREESAKLRESTYLSSSMRASMKSGSGPTIETVAATLDETLSNLASVEDDECVKLEQLSRMSSDLAKERSASSRTLSLTSKESNVESLLALPSARQTEHELTQRKRDNEATWFGGFAGPTDRDRVALWLVEQESMDTKAEGNAPESEHRNIVDRPPSPHAHMERTPSFTKRTIDSCDVFLESIGLAGAEKDDRTMSDEEFDNLPNWSDVEDDPEYNEVEERSCTNSSCSSMSAENEPDLIFPAVHMSSGLTGGVVDSYQVASSTEPDHEGSPTEGSWETEHSSRL